MERGGKTAGDWYTGSIDDAMRHAEDIWPCMDKEEPFPRRTLPQKPVSRKQIRNAPDDTGGCSAVDKWGSLC
jgi:hypothetical protein